MFLFISESKSHVTFLYNLVDFDGNFHMKMDADYEKSVNE